MLNVQKLEKVRHLSGGAIIARCPVCAKEGMDDAGNHLKIDRAGRFGCVVNPGPSGRLHRKEIFALVGEKKERGNPPKITWRIRL